MMLLTNYERLQSYQENSARTLENAAIRYVMGGTYSELCTDTIKAVTTQTLTFLYLSLQSICAALYFATKLDKGLIAASLREPLFSLTATVVLFIKGTRLLISSKNYPKPVSPQNQPKPAPPKNQPKPVSPQNQPEPAAPKNHPNPSKYNDCINRHKESPAIYYLTMRSNTYAAFFSITTDAIDNMQEYFQQQRASLTPILFSNGYNAPGMHVLKCKLEPIILTIDCHLGRFHKTPAIKTPQNIIDLLDELIYIQQYLPQTSAKHYNDFIKELNILSPAITGLIKILDNINTSIAKYKQKHKKQFLESDKKEDILFATEQMRIYTHIIEEIIPKLDLARETYRLKRKYAPSNTYGTWIR